MEKLAKGLNSVVKTGGFTSHGLDDRQEDDYYATKPRAVKFLLEMEDFPEKKAWECACGEGHLSKAMIEEGFNVYSSDLVNRGYGETPIDYLQTPNKGKIKWNIITNPPYKLAKEFILKSLSMIEDGYKVAMFLPIRYLEGKARKKLFEEYPPKIIYVSSSRIKCAINGDFDKMTGSAVCYAWFVWEKGYIGNTILKWFN